MAENNGQSAEQVGDAERQAEWARLAEEEGLPAKAPSPSDPADDLEGAGQGGGQDEQSPHEVPAAEKPAGEQAPSAADDIWKDAPEHLRNAYQAEREAREKAQRAVDSNNGRLSAESRRALQLEQELAELKKGKPEDQKEPEAALADEDRSRLAEEFPDVAAPLLKVIGSLEAKVAELDAGNASAAEQRTAQVGLELQRLYAEEEQKLATAHTDWREIADRPDFAEWVKAQPQMIKDALLRNGKQIVDATEAGMVIGMFKQHAGAPLNRTQDRREAQLRGNSLPSARVPGATTSATENREAEWKRLAALDAQKESQRARRTL